MKNISLNNITLEKANKDRKRVGRGAGSGLGLSLIHISEPTRPC